MLRPHHGRLFDPSRWQLESFPRNFALAIPTASLIRKCWWPMNHERMKSWVMSSRMYIYINKYIYIYILFIYLFIYLYAHTQIDRLIFVYIYIYWRGVLVSIQMSQAFWQINVCKSDRIKGQGHAGTPPQILAVDPFTSHWRSFYIPIKKPLLGI